MKIKKVFKLLIIAELVLIGAAVLLLLTANPDEEFSGFEAFVPMIGAAIVLIVILALALFNSAKNFFTGRYGFIDVLWLVAAMLGLPLFGLYYSTIGDNRESLAKVCTILLPIGALLSLGLLFRYLKAQRRLN